MRETSSPRSHLRDPNQSLSRSDVDDIAEQLSVAEAKADACERQIRLLSEQVRKMQQEQADGVSDA